MDPDDVDLYDDLVDFEEQNNQQDYRVENEKLKLKCDELEKQLTETIKRLEKLEKEHLVVATNLSSLMKTASVEVARKNRMISELRQEIDNVAFRRPNYKIPKKNDNHGDNSKPGPSHVNDSSRRNDNTKRDASRSSRVPEIVDNIKSESNYIEQNNEQTIKEEREEYRAKIEDENEDEMMEEEIYDPEKVSTTIYGFRLQKKLQQGLLAEATAEKIQKAKEADIKVEESNQLIENNQESKINNKENHYRLIPLDLKYEEKSKPDDFLDKMNAHDAKNRNNKRSREDSPDQDKRRKINDSERERSDGYRNEKRSSSSSSSRYDDKKTFRDDSEYFCPTKSDTEYRSKRQINSSQKDEKEYRYERDDPSRSNIYRNTRGSGKFDRNKNPCHGRFNRSGFREFNSDKRRDERFKSGSIGRRIIIKPTRRIERRLIGNKNKFENKINEREISRSKSRENGRERERNRNINEISNERYENKKSGDKERDRLNREERKSHEKKIKKSSLTPSPPPCSNSNKSTDFRDRLQTRREIKIGIDTPRSPGSPSPSDFQEELKEKKKQSGSLEKENLNTDKKKNEKKQSVSLEKENLNTADKKKSERIEGKKKQSVTLEKEKLNIVNEKKSEKKIKEKENNVSKKLDTEIHDGPINNVTEISNTLEEGEIIDSLPNSPNIDHQNISMNDSLREEKIENIEKFILNSMTDDSQFKELFNIEDKNEENKEKNSHFDDKDKISAKNKNNLPELLNDKKLIDEPVKDKIEFPNKLENLKTPETKIPLTVEVKNDIPVENDKKINSKNPVSDNIVDENKKIETNKDNSKSVKNDDDETDEKKEINESLSPIMENEKDISSSEVSMEPLEISAISSTSEKSNDNERSDEKINTTPIEEKSIKNEDEICETISNEEPLKTLSISSEKNQPIVDNNDKQITHKTIITKSAGKNSTENTKKKELKEKENDIRDKKKVMTVISRRRRPVKLSDT